MPVPEDLRQDMQDFADEITDLMDELEEMREDALDALEASADPGVQAAIGRMDQALRALGEAADALDADGE